MTSLLRAELRRLTARRVTRILALIVLGVLLLTLARVYASSHHDSPEVQRQRDAQRQEQIFQCEQAKARGEFGPDDVDCQGFAGDFGDPRLFSRTALPDGTKAMIGVVAMLAFVLGASSVGAEWAAGTMQALLFWEPRRTRVLVAKAVAAVVVCVGLLVAFTAVTYSALMLTAATRGSTAGATAGLHLSNLLLLGRGAVLVAAATLFGFAVAGLTRHTAAALGAFAVYVVGVEAFGRAIRPTWERFFVFKNFEAVMNKQTSVIARRVSNEFGDELFQKTLSGGRGAITIGVYAVLLVGAFWAAFTRRDVT